MTLISMDKKELIDKIQKRIRQEVIWEEVDKWVNDQIRENGF